MTRAMRRMPAWMAAPCIVLAGAIGLAGCAASPPAPRTVAASGGGGSFGTIVAVRPVGTPGRAGDPRDEILSALGAGTISQAPGSQAPGVAAAEFIVREDGGRTISVMQAAAPPLRQGDRVMLTGGARTRIARVAD